MSNFHRQNTSRLARIVSLEGGLAAFGLYALGSGVYRGEWTSIFWGVAILIGLGILVLVRRRDWKAHWETVEKPRKSHTPGDESEPPFV